MEAIEPEAGPFHPLHPLVARVIEALRPPSPGTCPSDPEQPKTGCLVELRRRRLDRNCSAEYLRNKQEILARVRLANQTLTPAPTGWTGKLADLKESPILQRRKLKRGLNGTPPPQVLN